MLVRDALSALQRGLFDAAAVERHLELQRKGFPLLRRQERERAEAAHFNDLRCYASVLAQQPILAERGLWGYRLAYTVATTGRLTQVGGGLQNASRAMKAAAYRAIDGIRNYDLSKSQPRLLVELMQRARIPCKHIQTYVDDPNAAAAAGMAAGIPEQLIKRVVAAAIFGPTPFEPASALRLAQGVEWRKNEIVAMVRTAVGRQGFEAAYGAVYVLLDTIHSEADAFARHIVDELAPAVGTRRQGDLYLPNATGMRLNLTRRPALPGQKGRPRLPSEARRKALAHLLQGGESAFIHHLTILLTARHVPVLSNEHDGLVVIGEVSDVAVAAARELSEYRTAVLLDKPFATPAGG